MRAALAFLLLTALAPALPADEENPAARLQALEADYLRALEIPGDEGLARQRRALQGIADLKRPMAQIALRDLLVRHGGGGQRARALEILRALVRQGPPADIDHAIRHVERSRDPLLLESLARILGGVKASASRQHLMKDALRRAIPAVKAQIVRAIGALDIPDASLVLLPLLRQEHLQLRIETMAALGMLRESRALPMIRVFAKHKDGRIRRGAMRALGLLEDTKGLPTLHAALADKDPRVVEAAAQAIGKIGASTSCPILIDGLEKALAGDLRVADAFAAALHRISGKAIGMDVELWRSWWLAVKDRPFVRSQEPAGGGTIEGPSYYGFPVRSSRVVFVLDVSRSMGWNGRLESAQKELQKTIDGLPRQTSFNIVVYSDGVRTWKPKLVDATPTARRAAISFVKGQKPDNGTNSHDALQRAFADEDVDTIFFLTDGHPTVGTIVDPDLILAAIRAWNRFRDVRIHTIALMRGAPPPAFAGREDPNRATRFMEELAGQNGGRFREIR